MNGQTIAVALGVLAGLVLMWSWAAGARAGRKVQKSIHHAGRTGNNAARILATAAVVDLPVARRSKPNRVRLSTNQ